jgi:hypothetical protein
MDHTEIILINLDNFEKRINARFDKTIELLDKLEQLIKER